MIIDMYILAILIQTKLKKSSTALMIFPYLRKKLYL